MKNKRRALPVIYILSVAAFAIFFAIFMSGHVHDTEYTSSTRSVVTSEGIYFAENLGDHAILYRMNANGRVTDILNTEGIGEESIEYLSVDGGNLYATVSKKKAANEDDPSEGYVTRYRILELDSSLNTLRSTYRFGIDDGFDLSSVTLGNSGICASEVSSDKKQIRVVTIPGESFTDQEIDDNVLITPENLLIKDAREGRFFLSAIYENGELRTRTDADEPIDYFAQNQSVSNAVSSMKLSAGQELVMYRSYFMIWLVALVIWLIVVTLIYSVLGKANRSLYSFILLEFVLAIIAGGGILFVRNQYRDVRKDEHTRFGIISLQGLADETGITTTGGYEADGFYDSEGYQNIQKAMADFITRSGNASVFHDVAVVRLSDGVILVSADGNNLESAVFRFGNAASDTITTLRSGVSTYAAADTILGGDSCRVVALSGRDFISGYALMGLIDDTDISSDINDDTLRYLILFIVVFAVGSVLLALICIVSGRDFRRLEYAMKETALGRTLPERPATVGADIKDMWDALYEIDKRVDGINYSKIKILEAYYRFAPKNLEFALGKESMLDVKNDSSVRLDGALLTISSDQNDSANIKDAIPGIETMLQKIEERQKGNDCIIVGKNSDLSYFRILFLKSGKGIVDFAAELIHDSNQNSGSFNSGFIFYDDFNFGIVGSEGLSFTYIIPDGNEDIGEYSDLFRTLHIPLVITEYVKLRDYNNKPLRFIGCIDMKTPGGIKLFEVLDACSVEERQAKLQSAKQFEAAYDSFRKKDFYIARNLFSDIVKLYPGDELARWYLFESEKYLNEGVEDEAGFGFLHN